MFYCRCTSLFYYPLEHLQWLRRIHLKMLYHRYDESVGYFYNEGIIKGKSNTEFGTYDSLKRGDAAVILSGALGLDTTSAPDAGFKDVNNRIKGHVNALVKEGVINGFSDTEFSPDTYLTRGQMAAILVRAFNLEKYTQNRLHLPICRSYFQE